MKIDAEFKCDFSKFKLDKNEDSGTLVATLGLLVRCNKDKSKRVFGDEFTSLAFDPFIKTDDDGVIRAGYKSMDPDFVSEIHDLTICGKTFACHPIIKRIKPVAKQIGIDVVMELPIVLEDKKFIGELVTEYGEVIEIGLKTKQMDLPIGAKGKGVVATKSGPWGNGKPQIVQ